MDKPGTTTSGDDNFPSTSWSRWTKRRKILKNVEKHMQLDFESSRMLSPKIHVSYDCESDSACRFIESDECLISPNGSHGDFRKQIEIEGNIKSNVKSSGNVCSISHTDNELEISNCCIFDEHGQYEERAMRDITGESLSSSSNSELEDIVDDADLNYQLASWASSFGIPLVAVASLLSILRPFHPSLPKDPRTLLNTPRTCMNQIKGISDGSYFHFGIIDSVTHILQNYL